MAVNVRAFEVIETHSEEVLREILGADTFEERRAALTSFAYICWVGGRSADPEALDSQIEREAGGFKPLPETGGET